MGKRFTTLAWQSRWREGKRVPERATQRRATGARALREDPGGKHRHEQQKAIRLARSRFHRIGKCDWAEPGLVHSRGRPVARQVRVRRAAGGA